jgi:hypothetical protein
VWNSRLNRTQDSPMLSGLMKPLADQARRAFREK